MKKLIRSISIILVLMLSISVLSGCGKKEKDPQVTQSPTSLVTGTDEPKNVWEIDKSAFDLDWYIGLASYSWVWNSEECAVHKAHKENTGLNHITFHAPASDSNEKLGAMIATQTVPDLITLVDQPGRGREQISLITSSDLVYDLRELSEQYAPDFFKRIPPSILNWHTYPDGNFYGYVSLIKAPEIVKEINSNTNLSLITRQDIMDQLGIKSEDFSTQDGMIEALKKVRNAKLQQNGIDIVPFLYSGAFTFDAIEWHAQYFGLTYEDKDGNYIMPLKNPKFLEMLKFTNRLYREELLTQENIIMKMDAIKPYVGNGTVFMLFGNTALGQYGPQMTVLYEDTGGKATYTAVEPVLSSDGSYPWQKTNTLKGYTHTFISKSTKIPERVIRLFDYFNTPEVQLMDAYGIDGLHYEMVDGKVKYIDEIEEIRSTHTTQTNAKYGFPDIMYFLRDGSYMDYYPLPTAPSQLMLEDIKEAYRKYLYVADPLTLVGPVPGDPLTTTNAKIMLYFNNELINMITADSEEACVQKYNEAMKKVEEMGYNNLEELFNQQFQEGKSKMGIDMLYPENKR